MSENIKLKQVDTTRCSRNVNTLINVVTANTEEKLTSCPKTSIYNKYTQLGFLGMLTRYNCPIISVSKTINGVKKRIEEKLTCPRISNTVSRPN